MLKFSDQLSDQILGRRFAAEAFTMPSAVSSLYSELCPSNMPVETFAGNFKAQLETATELQNYSAAEHKQTLAR